MHRNGGIYVSFQWVNNHTFWVCYYFLNNSFWHTDVKTANRIAKEAEEAAGQAKKQADNAQAAAKEAKTEVESLKEAQAKAKSKKGRVL